MSVDIVQGRMAAGARGVTGDATRTRSEWLYVVLAAVSISVALNLWMGRDLNWDYFNYHGYAAVSVLQDRLAQDFWPAGVQGYLNPLPFLPFAWMQQAGWPSAIIASVLAAYQSFSLVALYGIARSLSAQAANPRWTAGLMTLLGSVSAVYWSQIGSTFVDATTAPLIMAALWLMVANPSFAALAAAAALAGVATALKLTNVPFALALFLCGSWRLACMPPQQMGRFVRQLAALAVAGLAGFALFYGWWGWRLTQEFGSPFFPFFNSVFKAPDATLETATYLRYVPQNLTELLTFALRMMDVRSWVYTEVIAPDFRPALLLLLAPMALLVLLVHRWRGQRPRQWPAAIAASPAATLWVFFLFATALWLVTSSNGRYAPPLLLLLGPLLWLALYALLGERSARIACALLCVLQALHAGSAGNPRWAPMPWSHAWLPAGAVPAALREEPLLFVTVGRPSESYLAGLVHPQSAFVNPIGVVSLRNDGPGWSRFTALRDRFAGKTQVVFIVNAEDGPAEVRARARGQNLRIDRLGLRMDENRCVKLEFNGLSAGRSLGPGTTPDPAMPRPLASCPAALTAAPDPVLTTGRQLAQTVMDAFEERCPKLFSPRETQVEGDGRVWSRYYGKFDLYLTIETGAGAILFRQEQQADPIHLGNLKSWRDDIARFECQLPHGGKRGISTLLGGPVAPSHARP